MICLGKVGDPLFKERRFPNPPSNLFVPFADFAGRPCRHNRGLSHESGLRNPQMITAMVLGALRERQSPDWRMPSRRSLKYSLAKSAKRNQLDTV